MFPSEPLPESIDPNKARERLSAHLAHLEHRVLLVLDDIWKFGDLRDLVALGEHAHSTIMFTTRNAKIAKRANFEQHFVGLLDENLAMQLFCKWAFHADEVPADKANFARCAWEMATECGGLPLALTVIGSLASGYSMIEEWKSGLRKLRNSGSLSDDHEEQLMARLRHSYEDLDDDLKSFFLCLVGFPEDYHVKVSDLVEHWTALKYGVFEDGGHYIEDINEGLIDCCAMFGELVDRSLIIVDQSGLCGYQRREEDIAMSFIGFQDSAVESMSCYMHDSVRDMGRQVMSQLDPGERDRLVCPKVQLLRGKASSVTELWACSDPSVTWPDGIQLPALASLVAREAGLTSLPQCVIDCSQLRVLDVGFTDMAALPDDISTLQSLQLLRIDGCSKISALPAGISALHRLVMLSARLCKSLGSLPSGIGALSTLSCLYLVGCGFGSIPRSIGNLQNLGKLDLSFCTNLRELPLTLGSLSHLECLNLAGCKNIKSLPDFSGLSCLRSLNVSGMEGITELPASLTSLGMLTLLDAQGCQKLKSFPEGSKQWPRLKVLQLQGCNELDGLPHMSGHLQKVSSLGLPLITEEELWCRFKDDALTDEQFERQLQAPVEICGRKLYLQCGSVNGSLRDWIWQHQERVEWMPREQYLYMTMKGSGRTIPQMKALMGVKLLEGESVDAVDKNGRTPLHNAAENKDVESLLKLIRAGANLDARDEFGRTPLHYAAVAGAVEAVTALLRAGAGVDAKDKVSM
ncbi:unnamed protein product [Ostreobium quekettii]|uniref:NB-ARC domain-containing protein n=1 Tax=Ostreobium quekettii TaxID=121088 RepID=A0A8S1JCR5_9CHLO|nr:unnamed protein product [Ostreobium quekettii]